MGRLSDDGQWWWDGKTWVPTSQVVLPQLPPREPEQLRRATKARERLERYSLLYVTNDIAVAPVLLVLLLPLYLRGDRAMRDYRAWTLDQLALATSYLLGPDESMVAGETTLLPPGSLTGDWKRDLALAVTEAHVVVFRIDYFGGQPRWIAHAASAKDVTIEKRPPLEGLFRDPALVISKGDAHWTIQGSRGVWKPDPVVEAWRQAANRGPGNGLSA